MDSDSVDGKFFGFRWWNKNASTTSQPPTSNNGENSKPLPKAPPMSAEIYDMDHARRGLALIFSHDRNRIGGKIDEKSISRQFKDLSFEVEVLPNLKKTQILSKLDEVANYDHRDCDCLVVVVMTHGDSNKLCAADSSYNTSKLWEAFTAEKCPTLAGKPKLFFIQACRGSEYDNGVRVCATPRTETDAGCRATYTIPAMADILIANATFDGYFAWRDGRKGSWFIQELGECLERYSETKEICQILTIVNRKVAIIYESFVPEDLKQNKKKQMPNFLSTLTRELYFKKKPEPCLKTGV